jgi:hypothetical protein
MHCGAATRYNAVLPAQTHSLRWTEGHRLTRALQLRWCSLPDHCIAKAKALPSFTLCHRAVDVVVQVYCMFRAAAQCVTTHLDQHGSQLGRHICCRLLQPPPRATAPKTCKLMRGQPPQVSSKATSNRANGEASRVAYAIVVTGYLQLVAPRPCNTRGGVCHDGGSSHLHTQCPKGYAQMSPKP